ncbi:MAG: 30S ribosomal protein S13 [Puniceicoccales bacterium]|jgi:small subunit ribosomal protein S13|nr:30S ribosomal protein S13 [Puniceicoccales bacterium]
MPRLLGVDVPENKHVAYALRYIYGIGPKRAELIVDRLGLDPMMRSRQLNEEQISRIMSVVSEMGWKVEGDLRRELIGNLKRLQAIRCYRGIRHQRGLPVRGQRTSTNARTRKGARKTVGVVRKASAK